MVLCADFDRVFTIGSGITDRETGRQECKRTGREIGSKAGREGRHFCVIFSMEISSFNANNEFNQAQVITIYKI